MIIMADMVMMAMTVNGDDDDNDDDVAVRRRDPQTISFCQTFQ